MPAFAIGFLVSADWRQYENKDLWVADAVAKTGQREYLWIDDAMPPKERLEYLALDPRRGVKINPKGANELEILQGTPLQLLSRS